MQNDNSEFNFRYSEIQLLLNISRESIKYYLETGKTLEYDERVLPDIFHTESGAFVSIYKGRALRGCIGRLSSDVPLYKLVQKMSISAATSDPRFSGIKFGELDQICIEISVLSPLKRIYSKEEIELGKHGIYIKKDSYSGTFLPQVAESTGWSLEEFLGHCSQDKAGIGWEGWKNAELYVYTAHVFKEKAFKT